MAEDAQELEQAAKLPFSERVAHKNWKVRSEAYADIRSACERAASADDLAIPDIGAPVRAYARSFGWQPMLTSGVLPAVQQRCWRRQAATQTRLRWTKRLTRCSATSPVQARRAQRGELLLCCACACCADSQRLWP